MIARAEAERRLLQGDRLIHDLAGRTWMLLQADAYLRHHVAAALLSDATLALSPAGDQLPGFPMHFSQTWHASGARS